MSIAAFLADLSPVDWLLVAGASWLILACVSGGLLGRLMAGADARDREWYQTEGLWPDPPQQSDLDLAWADVSEVIDEDAACNRKFVSLMSHWFYWDEYPSDVVIREDDAAADAAADAAERGEL